MSLYQEPEDLATTWESLKSLGLRYLVPLEKDLNHSHI